MLDGWDVPAVRVDVAPIPATAFVLGESLLGGPDVLSDGRGTWVTLPPDHIAALSIRRGRSRDDQADQAGDLTLTLSNQTGDYDPDNDLSPWWWRGASVLGRGLPIRVVAEWRGDDWSLFTGYVESLDADATEDPNATLVATDALGMLGAASDLPALDLAAFQGDTTAERVARVLDMAGWMLDTDLVGNLPMQATTLGAGPLALCDEAAACELARLIATRDGCLRMVPYPGSEAPVWRFHLTDEDTDDGIPYETLKTSAGSLYMVNVAQVEVPGVGVYEAADDESVARYGARSVKVTAPLLMPADAQALAHELAGRRSQPRPRLDEVTVSAVDIIDADTWRGFLACDLGDQASAQRTTVDGRTRHWDLIVESIAHDISVTDWKTTFTLSPAPAGSRFVLGQSLLGGADVLAL